MKLVLARLRRDLSDAVLYDEGIEAARNACAAGASIASAAITAAAFYDSPLVGIHALRECMHSLQTLPFELEAWVSEFQCRYDPITRQMGFASGFGYVDDEQAAFLVSVCERHYARRPRQTEFTRCSFFLEHQGVLASKCGPLNRVGLMALVSLDHAIDIEDAERYFMLWQLDSAIREAQRARQQGLAEFPFLSEYHQYEGPWPSQPQSAEGEYLVQLGLEEQSTES